MNINFLIEAVELYLEGVKIPTFSSITINEQENMPPSGRIVFSASSPVLHILGGTVVQIFVKVILNEELKTFLLFEGEVSGISYSDQGGSTAVSINVVSLLGSLYKAKLRPSHSVVTAARKDAELNQAVNIRITNNLEYGDQKIFSDNTVVNKSTDNSVTAKTSVTGTLNQLKEIAVFSDIADSMAKQFNAKGSEMSKGNYIEFIKEVNRFFMQADIYYGLQAIAYRIPQSMIALPNQVTGFSLKITLNALNDAFRNMNLDPTGSNEVHILMNLLNRFSQYLEYKFIAPASPIATKYFNVKYDSKSENRALRLIYMPDFEASPAPLCNVFFPNQLSSLGFSRDFVSEPTRMIGQLNYSFIDKTIPSNMMPLTVVPNVFIHNPKEAKYSTTVTTKYTDEEAYRGVVLKVSEHDGTIVQTLKDIKNITTVGDKKEVQPLTKEDEKEVIPTLNKLVLSDFLKLKYGQRVITVNTAWNPYRLIGLPVLIVGEDDKPSFTGILQSVTTTLQAAGQAVSSCSIRNCRILFDDKESEVFSKSGSSEDNIDNLDNFVISDLASGGIMGANPLLHKQDFYGFENIGKEIYPLFINGGLTKDSNLHKFFAETPDLYDKNAYIDVDENLKDFSIMRFYNGSYANENNEPLEVFYTRLVYKAVAELKTAYNKATDKWQYSSNLNKRKLLTKQEYLNNLGGLSLDDTTYNGWKENSKDLGYILQLADLPYSSIVKSIVTMNDRLNTEDVAGGFLELFKLTLTDSQKTNIIKQYEDTIKDLTKEQAAVITKLNNTTTDKDVLRAKIINFEELIKSYNQAIDAINTDNFINLPQEGDILSVFYKEVKTSEFTIKNKVRETNSMFKPYNTTRRAHANQLVKEFTQIKSLVIKESNEY